MNVKVEATGTMNISIDDANWTVGDTIDVEMRCRIVSVAKELIDVTSYRSRTTEVLPSGRTVKLLILSGTF